MKNNQTFLVRTEASNAPFTMTTNPAQSLDFVSEVEPLVEACGVLPQMLASNKDPQGTMKDAIEGSYPFGAHWNGHGVVDEQGIYRHPEDPPLYPVAVVENVVTKEAAYIYQSALVAVVDDSGKFITGRFD